MRPTKEECVKAIEIAQKARCGARPGSEEYQWLKDFLVRCQKSLPSKASVEKDRDRRKKVK